MPSNNTYVVIRGFLKQVDADLNSAQPSLFHIGTENISFLGKAVDQPALLRINMRLVSRSNSYLTVFQRLFLPHVPPDFGIISTQL